MSVLSSFWERFLEFLDKNQEKTPILYSVLKQVKPAELTESELVLGCENQGVQFFLEKKVGEIEYHLFKHLNKKIKVRMIVSSPKKQREEPPLLNFQPSIADVFARCGLHAKFSFDNFAVSSSNQVAYAASQAVADNLGASYNPLFLYGGVGVGKTHLAQSVAKRILEKDSSRRVFFCPGDQFTNELIESIRERSTPRFRRKYRHLNLLIIDDIQFIAGKETVQEEFFHTFNSIVSSGGQIILTSDRPPSEIKNLEDRLRSRFSGGLIVDIQNPDFELRTAIILIKAKEKNIEIDLEAAKIIAEQSLDGRGLEGTLLSVYAKVLGIKDRVDLEAVVNYFSEKNKVRTKKITSNNVVRAVCSFYNVKQSHLKSRSRTDSLALARQVAMFILREELRLKLEEVAMILKRKDHTTVIHGIEKVRRMLAKDQYFKQEVDGIIKSLSLST
jgi:chromosomal replication initiator protein